MQRVPPYHGAGGLCRRMCYRYVAMRPHIGDYYVAGHGRCLTCSAWLHRSGCHLPGGSPVGPDDDGWLCNCCGHKVTVRPPLNKNVAYGPEHWDGPGDESVDVGHFSNWRATLLKRLARCIPRYRRDFERKKFERAVMETGFSIWNTEREFECTINRVLGIIYSDIPNKQAMAVEFEHIKGAIGRVPTRADIDRNSRFGYAAYEKEFEDVGILLYRLRYDPWLRDNAPLPDPEPVDLEQYQGREFVRDVGLLNRMIERAMSIIKADRKVRLDRLAEALDLEPFEMRHLVPRLTRIDGVGARGRKPFMYMVWGGR